MIRRILKQKKIKIPLSIALLTTIANYTSEDFNQQYDAYNRMIIALLADAKCYLFYLKNGKKIDKEFHEYAANVQFKCFKKCAGTYIKLGQYIAQQEHQMNKAWTTAMEPLCQVNTETDFKVIKETIEKEFGKKIEEMYSEFEEKPVASASIGQVHKAKLKSNNKIVAVKVQHPKIAFQSIGDIQVGKFSMKVCEYYYPDFKFAWMYDELEKNMNQELDFITEAENCRKIGKFFKGDDKVVVPEIIDEFSGKKVITMTWEEGKSITDREYRIKNKIKTTEIAELLANAFNKQIFEFGFVHGDPHSGNLFMRKENENGTMKTKLVLLDHGLYETLDDKFRLSYASLWRGIINQNEKLIIEGCKGLNISNEKVFVTMVTGKGYDDIMDESKKFQTGDRLTFKKRTYSPEEKKKIKKWVEDNIHDMFNMFDTGARELCIVLKVVDYLKSIDERIGHPINNFNIMFNYIYDYLHKDLRNMGKGYFEVLSMNYEYYKFKFFYFALGNYFTFTYWWNRLFRNIKEINEENIDLTIKRYH